MDCHGCMSSFVCLNDTTSAVAGCVAFRFSLLRSILINMTLVKSQFDNSSITPNEDIITIIGKSQNVPKLSSLQSLSLVKLTVLLTQRMNIEAQP